MAEITAYTEGIGYAIPVYIEYFKKMHSSITKTGFYIPFESQLRDTVFFNIIPKRELYATANDFKYVMAIFLQFNVKSGTKRITLYMVKPKAPATIDSPLLINKIRNSDSDVIINICNTNITVKLVNILNASTFADLQNVVGSRMFDAFINIPTHETLFGGGHNDEHYDKYLKYKRKYLNAKMQQR